MDIHNKNTYQKDIMVEFNNVSFGYNRERRLLDNASFYALKGEIIGKERPQYSNCLMEALIVIVRVRAILDKLS